MALSHRPVIVGAGLAGLMTALELAPEPVVVLSAGRLGDACSTAWAQGGIAAAIGADDAPELHWRDTLAAGNGICAPDVARAITDAGPRTIAALRARGVRFDTAADGTLRLGREAAHSRARIVHAGGDATGREILRALIQAVRATPSITILEGVSARKLLLADGSVAGVQAASGGAEILLPTARVVIATGGLGGLYLHTTNPRTSFGQGLALAALAGAALTDLEFVQFHPTAFDTDADPLPLISEAVRGDGARLIDEHGDRFMAAVPGAELAARDVVARAIAAHRAAGHATYIDARTLDGFSRRFPGIAARCAASGLDPQRDPIPVIPAAHYHMGGIAVDASGHSSVPGLWAVGEAACTGLHGANRLASNSLLEAAVCAVPVAASVGGSLLLARAMPRADLPPAPDPAADPTSVRALVSRAAGVVRDGATLAQGIAEALPLALARGPAQDAATVALMLLVACAHRQESRGGHFRADAPHENSAWARHVAWTLREAVAAAPALAAAS